MTHIDEDRLLEYALEACANESDCLDIERHLADCTHCRERIKAIRNDIEIVGGVRPNQTALSMPVRKARHSIVYPLLRAAALVIFGIFVGFSAANVLHRQPALVLPAYVELKSPNAGATAMSDATEIPQSYYAGMLNSVE